MKLQPKLQSAAKYELSEIMKAHKLDEYIQAFAADLLPLVSTLDHKEMETYLKSVVKMKRVHVGKFMRHIWCGPGKSKQRTVQCEQLIMHFSSVHQTK